MNSLDSRRIVLASALTAILVAAAIGVTIWSFDSALRHRDHALQAVRDTQLTQSAETLLWREREAMNEYLLLSRGEILKELDVVHGRLKQILGRIRIDVEQERRLINEVRQANERLVAGFRAGNDIRELNALEPEAVSLLNQTRALNERVARESVARADRANGRALTAGVLAGLFALAGALGFTRYAARLLRRLARQNAELQQLDQLKDSFLASVSHELRTPLTSIRGYLELVLDREAGELNDEQEQFLRVVERNSERLLGLVGDLLFVAQIDAGRLELIVENCDLADMLASAVEGIRPLADSKEIDLAVECDSPVPVSGDPGRLGQLADNLLSNAVKFTPQGGRVRAKVGTDGAAGCFEIADSGIGIPEAEQARLFERFFRASSATERSIQGTGLGLSIAKAIVEAHGGDISLTSIPGKGTTFRVELPSAVPGPQALEEEVAA